MKQRIYNPVGSGSFQLKSRRSRGSGESNSESGRGTYKHRALVDSAALRAELIAAGLLVPANTLTSQKPSTGPVLRIGKPPKWMHEVKAAERSCEEQQTRMRGGR